MFRPSTETEISSSFSPLLNSASPHPRKNKKIADSSPGEGRVRPPGQSWCVLNFFRFLEKPPPPQKKHSPPFSQPLSLFLSPLFTHSLVYLRIEPLAAGWAKLQEISEYLELFNASGKQSIAFLTRGGEKEYYLASACSKVFIAPTASLSLRGVGVAGTFLRGVFEKFGITPEVRRIGNYKR